jgi:CubicO group peptidase (beta-lactamase class C family)
MKRISLVASIILILMIGSVQSQDFSKLLDGYFAYNRFWGSILIVQNDKVLFQKSYGFADKDNKIVNDANTLFQLASVTKTMTATAIMKLHDEGKLSVYDRVDKYIPGFINDDTKDIKIINLLNHTSGMAANFCQRDDQGNGMVLPGKEPVTLEQLIAKFRDTKLKYQPGTKFEYNNYAYSLLAYIIEKVSGIDYPTYLNQAIFSKAGMTNTYYKLNLPKSAAIGYEGMGTNHAKPVVHDESHPSWILGAANMYSSTSDLAKYINAEFSCKILSSKTLKMMLDTCVESRFPGVKWLLGWTKQTVGDLEWYAHGGDGGGFATKIGYIPSKNVSVIILSNLVRETNTEGIQSTAYTFVDEIAENVIKLINNKELVYPPVPEGKTDKKICGSYKLDDTHVMRVSLQNDSLFFSADSVTVFDYIYHKKIAENSNNVKVCKSLCTSFLTDQFDGFEKNANKEMQEGTFNKDGYSELSGVWKYLTSKCGKFQSYSIYNIRPGTGNTTYCMAYHFEKSDLLMELSFNQEGLINGFFITSIFPKCQAQKINMVAVGGEEYFVDGYKYGGYKDYRIKFDKARQTLNFSAEGDEFNAVKL